MRFTKLGHSCVRLEKDGAVVVIDPGAWSDAATALTGAAAVLATHEHDDHLDADAVRTALRANPELTLWSTPSVTAKFAESGDRCMRLTMATRCPSPALTFTSTATFMRRSTRRSRKWRTRGFLVDGDLFHPGDSLTVPKDPVRTLLLPISAPWLTAGAMIDYFREVAPARGYAIHDAILTDNGLGIMTQLMTLAAAPTGAPVARLDPGTSLEL